MIKFEDIENILRNWAKLSDEYHALMAIKQFGYVEWIAIIFVVGGLCFQDLLALMEKGYFDVGCI